MTARVLRSILAALPLLLAPAAAAQEPEPDDDWVAEAEAELDGREAAAPGEDAGTESESETGAATAAGGEAETPAETTKQADGAAPGDHAAPPAAPAALDWQRELDAIADLLIDDRFTAAKVAAEDLLAAPGIPQAAAARARDLLAKAQEHLPPPAPPPPPEPPFPTASFSVRVTEPGRTFAAGETGKLRIDATGVSFVAGGKRQWGVPWERVTGLTAAEGLWDARHPLELQQRGGPSRYLASIDGHGGHQPPDRLLSAFGRARREAQARREAAGNAAAAAAESTGKESGR